MLLRQRCLSMIVLAVAVMYSSRSLGEQVDKGTNCIANICNGVVGESKMEEAQEFMMETNLESESVVSWASESKEMSQSKSFIYFISERLGRTRYKFRSYREWIKQALNSQLDANRNRLDSLITFMNHANLTFPSVQSKLKSTRDRIFGASSAAFQSARNRIDILWSNSNHEKHIPITQGTEHMDVHQADLCAHLRSAFYTCVGNCDEELDALALNFCYNDKA